MEVTSVDRCCSHADRSEWRQIHFSTPKVKKQSLTSPAIPTPNHSRINVFPESMFNLWRHHEVKSMGQVGTGGWRQRYPPFIHPSLVSLWWCFWFSPAVSWPWQHNTRSTNHLRNLNEPLVISWNGWYLEKQNTRKHQCRSTRPRCKQRSIKPLGQMFQTQTAGHS